MMINTEKIIEIVFTLTSNEYNVISKIILYPTYKNILI